MNADTGFPVHLLSTPVVQVGQATSPGVKEINEDCIGIRIPEGALYASKGVVVAIADGVSAAEAGKEASEACIQGFMTDYYSTPDDWSVSRSAHAVLSSLNRWLWSTGQRNADEARGFISTLSLLILKSSTAHIFHVGDARIHLLRAGKWQALTRDHRARVGRKQHYLVRAVGLDQVLEVDYRAEPVEAGDLFFLCTDGVHECVTPEDAHQQVLASQGDLERAARKCIDLAASRGSDDNLSCQFLQITALPERNAEDTCRQLSRLPFPPPLAPGMRVDGYEIVRELHASSRSQVYLVRDTESGRELVMKTPSVNFSDDPAYIERFMLEEWIGKRLDSPYIARVIRPRRERTFLYYLSEYVAGPTLADWMRQNPRPDIQEVLMLVQHIARGLQKFLRRDCVHQDLKPANIVLDPKGILKIVDFGSCHIGGVAEISAALTRDIPLGTRSYSAPELRWGGKPDPRCDQFSLAVICYEMLAGRKPFGDMLERVQTEADLQKLAYVPAHTYNPLVPPWVDCALARALQPEREERYPEISEFVHDLTTPNPSANVAAWLGAKPAKSRFGWRELALLLIVTQLITGILLFS